MRSYGGQRSPALHAGACPPIIAGFALPRDAANSCRRLPPARELPLSSSVLRGLESVLVLQKAADQAWEWVFGSGKVPTVV